MPRPRGARAHESTARAAGERRPCRGEAKHGACKAFALPGSDYCISHDASRRGQLQASRAKGGRHAAKLRVLKGQRQKLDTTAALVRFRSGLVQDVLAGAVAPEIGRCVLYGISIQRALVEAGDLEERLSRLEQAQLPETRGGRPWGR